MCSIHFLTFCDLCSLGLWPLTQNGPACSYLLTFSKCPGDLIWFDIIVHMWQAHRNKEFWRATFWSLVPTRQLGSATAWQVIGVVIRVFVPSQASRGSGDWRWDPWLILACWLYHTSYCFILLMEKILKPFRMPQMLVFLTINTFWSIPSGAGIFLSIVLLHITSSISSQSSCGKHEIVIAASHGCHSKCFGS